MNEQERVIKCGKIAYDILHGNLLLKRITTVSIITTSDELYRALVVNRNEYGIFSRKFGEKITVLPKFLAVYDNGQFTPLDYLAFRFISKYTTMLDMRPLLLPPPRIYIKEVKKYSIKDLRHMIKEKFRKWKFICFIR